MNSRRQPLHPPRLQHVITSVIHPDIVGRQRRATARSKPSARRWSFSTPTKSTSSFTVLLDELRRGSGARRSVTVDARWLLLNSDDLDRLGPPGRRTRRQARGRPQGRSPSSPAGPPASAASPTASAARACTSSAARAATSCEATFPSSAASSRPVTPADLVAYDRRDRRRPVAVAAAQFGGGTAAGTSGGGRSVGYQPVIETPNFGVLLKIRPTLHARRRSGGRRSHVDDHLPRRRFERCHGRPGHRAPRRRSTAWRSTRRSWRRRCACRWASPCSSAA